MIVDNDDLNPVDKLLLAIQIPCDVCGEIMCDGFCDMYLNSLEDETKEEEDELW